MLDHDPCTPPKEKPKQTSSTSGELECRTEQEIHPQQKSSVNTYSAAEPFSPEKDALFARRYEEGYNLYDARYVSWIRVTHPDNNSQELLSFFPDVSPLGSVPLLSLNDTDDTPNINSAESVGLPSPLPM